MSERDIYAEAGHVSVDEAAHLAPVRDGLRRSFEAGRQHGLQQAHAIACEEAMQAPEVSQVHFACERIGALLEEM